MRPAEGEIIDGRYRIRSLIGSGGMADVWLADDLELSRQVALKILHPHFAGDPAFIERFRREAESAAALQHNNIVPIFDRGQVGDTYYIAMAWIRGRTLRQLIDQGLTVDQSVGIVMQVLRAAGFAHANGVIHRDLKPMNILVEDSGRVLVTDFGIARAGAPDLTEVGTVVGTANYLSPEQAEGEDVGPESDLYSIGVILYECLTGRVPFPGENAVQVALRQLSELPEAPSHINPAVSPALDGVVDRALRRERSARFRTADEFAAALDQAVADPTGGSPAPERDRRKLIAGVALAVIAAVVAFGLLRPNSVTVPDVTGDRQTQAINGLAAAGFGIDQVRRVKSNRPAGIVVRQDPVGEARRDCAFVGYFCSDPKVDLFLSGGPGQVEVPDVAGLSQEEAQAELEEAGFEVDVQERASSEYPEGQASGTKPPAGGTAPSGSTIVLFISSGPSTVAVPAVVGLTLEAARQQLAARGLEISTSEEPGGRPEGEVTAQNPDAGTRVDSGSTVELTVSSGPPADVSVPNVVGQLRRDAVLAIRAEGLVPIVVEQTTTELPQDGRVIDQDPAADSLVADGTQVTLTVGVFSP